VERDWQRALDSAFFVNSEIRYQHFLLRFLCGNDQKESFQGDAGSAIAFEKVKAQAPKSYQNSALDLFKLTWQEATESPKTTKIPNSCCIKTTRPVTWMDGGNYIVQLIMIDVFNFGEYRLKVLVIFLTSATIYIASKLI
jgi:hypothetical protein